MERAYPALLRAAGYETAYVGKFHMSLNSAPRPGFDYWAGLPGQGEYVDPEININGTMTRLRGHSSGCITDLALDWLRKPHETPFCLIVSYKEAHGPFTPPDHLRSLYSDVQWRPRPFPAHAFDGKPAILHGRSRPPKSDSVRPGKSRLDYWRCITAADEQIGRILAHLDETDQTEKTVTAFAGDNGFFMGEMGLSDKRYAYDPALRIPLLLRYPKAIPAGRVVFPMTLNLDLCPTLLQLAGVPVPDYIHGRSLRPILNGGGGDWRSSFLYEYFQETHGTYGQPLRSPPPTIKAVRTERYKYIEYPGSDYTPELYDLAVDPNEWHNLSGDPSQGSLQSRLRGEMARIERETRS
jgi:arylsulfatase A-like enzyme